MSHKLLTLNVRGLTRTITAAGNRTRASLSSLLRQYELTIKNVSYFLTNQSKTKTFIDLKVTRNPKPTKNSTAPYLNEIPVHFKHEIKTKGYDVIGVNLFLPKLMNSCPQKGTNRCALYYLRIKTPWLTSEFQRRWLTAHRANLVCKAHYWPLNFTGQ